MGKRDREENPKNLGKTRQKEEKPIGHLKRGSDAKWMLEILFDGSKASSQLKIEEKKETLYLSYHKWLKSA